MPAAQAADQRHGSSVAQGRTLRGLAASPGKASGPVFLAPEEAGGREKPVSDFSTAVEAVASRLQKLADKSASTNPAVAEILQAQMMMSRDPSLAAAVEAGVVAGGTLPEAVRAAADEYAGRLEALDDAYLRERAADVREVGRLLRLAFTGSSGSRLEGLVNPSVVVAHELSPADTLSVRRDLLLGLVTEIGGLSAHAAIVARELAIPAVVGVDSVSEAAAQYSAAEIDGDHGVVRLLGHADIRTSVAATTTVDVSSAPVRIMANIGSSESADVAAERGSAGIGLFRTEFMFMSEDGPMREDDQLQIYSHVCELMSPHPVVVRTLDSGADKALPYLAADAEPNPQLGKRGVRIWLGNKELWRPQVRALLRTSARFPNLRVMLPMVAARSEMLLAHRLFASQAAELNLAVPKLGMMVEIPGVAANLQAFAGVTDFISLGTNDLTQYTVAADRELRWDADLSEMNPGVLHLIAAAVAAARTMGVSAGVCGEMAGRPAGAVFLVGVGVDSLSMTVDAIPRVVEVLSRLGPEGCHEAARSALSARSARSALRILGQRLAEA